MIASDCLNKVIADYATSAFGRKRKSEFRISSDFDVRFTPGSGRWDDRVLRGR